MTGANGSPVNFTATANAAAAASLELAGGNNQTGDVDAALPAALQVRAEDEFGNPVSGVTVNWAVTAGGGSVDPATSTTAATGIASAAFTLGPDAGANTATATATGLTGSPAEIDAAKRSFRVFAQRKEDASEPDGYVVPHTAFTYLLGPSGTYVTHFPDHVPTEQVIERLRAAIGGE